MRVLVGTLYSGESEFDECVAAIRSQTFKDFDHVIIRDLPKREAHRKLFTHFLDRKDVYDLLIKVDADTVIISDTLFEGIVEKFNRNDWLDCMNIAVVGFFTGMPVAAGIQIYRNTIRWDFEKETLFTDMPENLAGRYLYDQTDLAPAAYHNKNPSPLQAFHYGVHRGLKSIARTHGAAHWEYLQEVRRRFKKTGDVRIGLAVLGAELVYAGKLRKADADYTNSGMKNALGKYAAMNRRELECEIRRFRALNWGTLPEDLRRRLIRALRSDNALLGILYELTLFATETIRRIQGRWRHVTRADRSDPAVKEAPAPDNGMQRRVESRKMKVFVGTLYSGENEYDECVASIQSQTFRDFDHFVFKNLPNKEAHHTLFKSFLDRSSEYDILIKVDADVVLSSSTVFERIVNKMRHDDGIDVLAVAVHDFFTDELINAGMATFRNTVRWDCGKETMFVDIPEVPQGRTVYDDKELAPAGIHCKNPAPWQAFHYGLHRGLKSIQRIHSTGHWVYLEKVRANFQRTGDTRIGLAVLGAELAYAGRLKKRDVDYTNPRMRAVLDEYISLDSAGLEREIRRLRSRNWGVLPGDLRRRTIRALRSESVPRGILNELAPLAKRATRRIRGHRK